MGWRGHPPIHADRRVPGLVRRYKGLAAGAFRVQAGLFTDASVNAHDVGDLQAAVHASVKGSRKAWLAYYRRCIVDVGSKYAAQGIPPKRRKRQASDEAPIPDAWGPASSAWWADAYRGRLGDEAWWDPWLAGMLRYAESTAGTRIQHVNEATEAAVARVIQDGVRDGLSVAQVRDNITSLFLTDFTVVRAERIARTEVLNSARAGSFEAVIATGLSDVATKSWQDSGDALVRSTHAEATADNQDIPYLDTFKVRSERTGAIQELQFPGDSSLGADASNVVNCRCDLVAQSKR